MTLRYLIPAASAFALMAGAAIAQTPAAKPGQQNAQATAETSAASAASVTDAQLSSFAKATVALQANKGGDQKQIVEGSGITVAQYNAIADRMKTDAAFAAKVNEQLRVAAGGSASTGSTGDASATASDDTAASDASADDATAADATSDPGKAATPAEQAPAKSDQKPKT